MSGKPKITFWDNNKIFGLRRNRLPIPKHWFDESIFKSSFFDSISIFIPIVEGFIKRTAERALPKVTDAQIRREAEHMIEEEEAHSRVHRSYNKLLKNEGYETAPYESMTEQLMRFGDDYLSLKSQLAGSACAEHLTGMMGIMGIDRGIFEDKVDERMKKVWLWHLLEEVDHRSAVFDLYQHLGGGYFRRVIIMTLMMLTFITFHLFAHYGLIWQSGKLFDLSVHREGFKFLWGKKGLYRNLIPPFLTFYRPNFHPSQINIRDSLSYRAHRYRIEDELMAYFPK